MQIRKLSCATKRQILLQCLHSTQEMKKLVLFATLQIILIILQRQWLKVFLHMKESQIFKSWRGQQIELLSSLHRYIFLDTNFIHQWVPTKFRCYDVNWSSLITIGFGCSQFKSIKIYLVHVNHMLH